MKKSLFLLSFASVALALSPMSVAKTIFPGTGSPGDRTDTDECPAGQYLVGFEGRLGSWIDQIRILCAPVQADGIFAASGYQGPARGGNSGGPAQTECPVGSALTELGLTYTEGNRQVKRVFFSCNPGMKGKVLAGPADSNYNSDTLGGDRQVCPEGEVGTGLAISHGRHVNSIGLICNTLVRSTAASRGSGAVVKSSGRPAPAATTALAYNGKWNTVTNTDGAFTLVLTIVNPQQFMQADLSVVGEFVTGAAEYNGTLQGKIRLGTRILEYTYTQPGIQAAGTGTFILSDDGMSLTGSGLHMGKDQFTWNGTRSN